MGEVQFRVRHASDDRNSVIQTKIVSRAFMRDRVIDIYARRSSVSSSKEPTIEGFTDAIKKTLRVVELCRNSPKKSIVIRIGNCGYLAVLRKDGIRYNLNGVYGNLDILVKALARTIFRSCYIDGDGEEADESLDDYMQRCIDMPENITYVMENRVPYKFFQRIEGKIVEHNCRMNVMQIAPANFAVEISSGVWGEMGLKDLNTFINTYLNGHKKGKWYMIGCEELFFKTTGDKPTNAQVTIMKEYLKQNRMQDIVEKRAMELFDNMVRDYDVIKRGKFTKGNGEEVLAMYVRGKLADWMIVDNQSKRGIQDVSTYVLTKSPLGGKVIPTIKEPVIPMEEGGHTWSGPICIDNLSSGASVGDQFAARAFACMNDPMLVKLVSTVGRYITGHEKDQETIRLDWNAMS
tara:strand:+ start:2328 stop:3545 length:1218 start_codon:yes stop_codon:yes gene_type:complete